MPMSYESVQQFEEPQSRKTDLCDPVRCDQRSRLYSIGDTSTGKLLTIYMLSGILKCLINIVDAC